MRVLELDDGLILRRRGPAGERAVEKCILAMVQPVAGPIYNLSTL